MLESDLIFEEEIDDIQDLDIAESLFAESIEAEYDAIARRYGGYWRYPKILDYCYLVNPYYPSDKMKEELTQISPKWLDQYSEGLFVVKSISKSHGIPGARLGVLASGNQEVIRQIKNNLSI